MLNLRKNFCILIGIFVLSFNFGNKAIGQSQSIDFSIDPKVTSNFKVEDRLDSFKIIALDNVQGAEISRIGILKIIDDQIFIYDNRLNKFFIFDMSGKLIRMFSSYGRGPGEYLSVYDFNIDKNGFIEVLDSKQKKLLYLDYKNVKLGVNNDQTIGHNYYSRFEYLNGMKVYLSFDLSKKEESFSYKVFVINDKEINSIKHLPYKRYTDLTFAPKNPFSKFNDQLCFLPIYSNSVYFLGDNGRLHEKYRFTFINSWMDDRIFSIDQQSFWSEISSLGWVYFLNYKENSDNIFLSYSYKNDSYFTLIDKSENHISNMKVENTTPDLFGISKGPDYVYKDYFVFNVDALSFDKSISGSDINNNEIATEKNPVIVLVKFK